MNLRDWLLNNRKLLEYLAIPALFLMPLSGSRCMRLGRGTPVAEFFVCTAVVLGAVPLFVLVILSKPPSERVATMEGLSGGLRILSALFGVGALLSGLGGLGARQSGLDAHPVGAFGGALACAILFGGMVWLGRKAQAERQAQSHGSTI